MWCFGLLCYEMLSGCKAFRNGSRGPLTRASAEAQDIVEKLLMDDPGNRMSAKDSLAHPWFYGLKETPYS